MQVRQLEVCVRVDQTGHDGNLAEVTYSGGILNDGRAGPERDDAILFNVHPAVSNGRLMDRDDPRRANANQCGRTRSRLPVRLLAG